MAPITRSQSKRNNDFILHKGHTTIIHSTNDLINIQSRIDINSSVNINDIQKQNIKYIGFYNQIRSIIVIFQDLSKLFRDIRNGPTENHNSYKNLFKTTHAKIKELSITFNNPKNRPKTQADKEYINTVLYEMNVVKSQVIQMETNM